MGRHSPGTDREQPGNSPDAIRAPQAVDLVACLCGKRVMSGGAGVQAAEPGRMALLGLKALHTSLCVSMYGPPIRSTQ